MIELTLNNFTADRMYSESFFGKILEVATKEVELEAKKMELSINLVGEGRIKALNKKYRGKNKITDVLSFPLISGDRKTRKTGGLVMTEIGTKSVSGGILSLGDIFICLPVAKKYAVREGVSLDFKLAFLTVHGFLHLLGYDHEGSSEDKARMFKLQDNIVSKLKPKSTLPNS